MLITNEVFASIVAGYAGAYYALSNTVVWNFHSGVPPTESEIDAAGFDPNTLPGKIYSKTTSGSVFPATKISDKEAIIEFREVANLQGAATAAGTITYAVLIEKSSTSDYVIVPVGTADAPSVLNLNKLTFAVGETVQVLNYSQKITKGE